MSFLFYNHRERNTGKWSSLRVVLHQLIQLFYGILEGLSPSYRNHGTFFFFFLAFANVTVGLAWLGDNFLWVSDISACLRNSYRPGLLEAFPEWLVQQTGLKGRVGSLKGLQHACLLYSRKG